ncbi:MAG: Gfo/Idh/MocA family oxidoreductase [Bdellovibrionales bacterium]|nr:Gfo/Idh/MocA family oxidoreductase [Bdellovibrionales bacterium]
MTIRIGMIGSKGIARKKLLPALARCKKGVLWSVLSREQSSAEECGKEFGAQGHRIGFSHLDEFLSDEGLDAVIVASPDKLHKEHVLACAAAGKHVLCEKPFATSVSDANEMAQACKESGVSLGVAYHLRFHDGLRQLHRRIQEGELGTIYHARAMWSWRAQDSSNWRAHESLGRWWGLAGVGTHCIDQILWNLDAAQNPILEANSIITSPKFKSPHDEVASLNLGFASGAVASVTTSVLYDAPSRLEFYGENGIARCDGALATDASGSVRINGKELVYDSKDPYQGEIEDFLMAIEEGRTPEVPGAFGILNVEALERATGNTALTKRESNQESF